MDTRTQRNLAKLNDELYEVHQIMTRNVQEVLGVGEKLDRKFFILFTLQCWPMLLFDVLLSFVFFICILTSEHEYIKWQK